MHTQLFDYIIRPGDTLFSISLKFNVPLDTLVTLNNIAAPDSINAGETLKIPVTEEFYAIAKLVSEQCCNVDDVKASGEATLNDSITYKRHKVRRGDTVYMLAKEYNTTTGNILALNPTVTDVKNLQIGTVLTIPVTGESTYIYTVRPGDTVYSIARSHNTTVESIMKYNYIESDYTLYPGQQLVIV